MLEQDQEKLLEEATAVVKEQAFYMKRSIDNDNLRDSLKHASNMICELRTSLLSPKNYYELYMEVFGELQYLARFFGERTRHNRKMSDLYESVQHAGNVVPRLYLVITVGAMYMKAKEAPAKDILLDMTELCKGVQHPMRGLFLRYYLTQMCKDKLPDSGSEYEMSGGGTLEDAFEFLMTNFTECARLWVRLQHQGSVREKQRRERERHDLRVLVGSTLIRMSQLEGMSTCFYSSTALPQLAKQLLGCNDVMAQQYLLDCVIQVFSDECHLKTLPLLLSTCLQVQKGVDLKPILVNLMSRLARFIVDNKAALELDKSNDHKNLNSQTKNNQNGQKNGEMHAEIINGEKNREINGGQKNGEVNSEINRDTNNLQFNENWGNLEAKRYENSDVFHLFKEYLFRLYEKGVQTSSRESTEEGAEKDAVKKCVHHVADLASSLEMQVAFINFTLSIYPNNIEYVDIILANTVSLVRASLLRGENQGDILQGPAVSSVVDLLSIPLQSLSLAILKLRNYAVLMDFLDHSTKKKVALNMITSVIESRTPLENFEEVTQFFDFIKPLVQKACPDEDLEDDLVFTTEYIAEQQKIGQLIFLLNNKNLDLQFTMLTQVRDILTLGGSKKFVHSFPSLVIAALKLAPLIQNPTQDPPKTTFKKLFQFVHKTCTLLAPHDGETTIRLFLQAAIVVNKTQNPEFEPISYEFLTQALVVYEEELSDSRSQSQALTCMVGVLTCCVDCLERENYEALATKITQHGAKLLKKPEQCKSILMCSHLFWNNVVFRDGVRVLECLKKSLKIADIAVQSNPAHIYLFTQILDKYLYYFEQGAESITVEYITNLTELCLEHLRCTDIQKGEAHLLYQRIFDYVLSRPPHSPLAKINISQYPLHP